MSDVPPSPDHHDTENVEPGHRPDAAEQVPDPPVFPARSGAPENAAPPPSELWPEWTATSLIQPTELPPAALFAADLPAGPDGELAVIRLEGLSPRPPGPDPDVDLRRPVAPSIGTPTTGIPMAEASLLSLDDIEQATETPLELVSHGPLASMLSFGRDRAQTLYRRQTVLATLLLVVLFVIGAVTFPRSWRDPGPGLAVDTASEDEADEPAPSAGDDIGPVAEADPSGAGAGNRGSIAGLGSAPAKSTTRPATTEDARAEGNGTAVSTTTSIAGAETSATVGPAGTGQPCPGGLPIAGCTTTSLGPAGPTTVVVKVSTSTTNVLVVSTTVPTTEATTSTTRTSTTLVSTTTTRRTTTTKKPTTTTESTTTTRPTTSTTRRTTTTREPTTTTTTATTTTTTTTTPGPTESQGTGPTVVVCEDPPGGTTPTTDCLPDP